MSSYITEKTPGDTSWFTHDRFGMFIHFGLYSMPARHEWIKTLKETMTEEHYDKYFKHFNPDMFVAKEWVKAAKNAGMKYIVLTTKHHEGFCLFDSKYTDYKITNTPFGRDLVKEFVDACREEGLKVGFYYSLIDWHHPEFPIDIIHPRRNDADAYEENQKRDIRKYAEYMRNQVRELLTNYGKIDILWFDYSYKNIMPHCEFQGPDWMVEQGGKGKDEWESEKLIALIRSIQPDIILNDRAGIKQDITTPEQRQPTEWLKDETTGQLRVWEACQTFSGSWGYNRDEYSWKSHKVLLDMLVNTVSTGGNLIMNVGPTARGFFDYRAVAALEEFGNWMKYNSRSIYGCTMAEPEFTPPLGTRLTQSEDGKRLYIHILEYPAFSIKMKNLAGKIEYAQFLHDGSEIIYHEHPSKEVVVNSALAEETDDFVSFILPSVQPNIVNPVIEIYIK